MSEPKHIAVIGAGIAGLSCAKRLQSAGHHVTVFEKSRGAAGRMSTKRGESERGEGWQCDTGAQYFTARDPRFHAEVQRWVSLGVASIWSPTFAVFGTAPNTSHGYRDNESPQRFVGTPRMTAPARLLANTLTIQSQTTIQAIQREGAHWRLHSAEHGIISPSFDAVVLAVPAPQALPLLAAIHSDFAVLAEQIRMRGSWAFALRYDEPLALPFQAAFVNEGPLRWVAEDSHKPGRKGSCCWLLHASAEWSEAHLETTNTEVAEHLIAAFVALGGRRPDAWSSHRWRYADSEKPLKLGATWDEQQHLGVCGDWLNGGKVEGAWLSGLNLAEQILSSDT